MDTTTWAWRGALLLALFGLLTVSGGDADACCMVPLPYPGDVDQSTQDVLVAFHDRHEELVIRVRPFFRGADEPPASLAWLVTVPSAPKTYKTADPQVFEEARDLAERLEDFYEEQRPRPLNLGSDSGAADGVVASMSAELDIGAQVEVGPYAITPVKARGASAVGALNDYLKEHGFATEDPGHLAWFAQNEFTFLCIKITPPEGSARLGAHLDLVPLQIGFEAEKPYYPGMYSANQGQFGLELTLLTTKPVAKRSLDAVRGRLRGYGGAHNLFTVAALPTAIAPAVADASVDRWYVNRVVSHGFNAPDASGQPAISRWKDDVTWTLGGAADLPPDWYYGDGSRPLLHPHNWWTLLGIALVALLLTALVVPLWILLRRRRAARRRAAA